MTAQAALWIFESFDMAETAELQYIDARKELRGALEGTHTLNEFQGIMRTRKYMQTAKVLVPEGKTLLVGLMISKYPGEVLSGDLDEDMNKACYDSARELSRLALDENTAMGTVHEAFCEFKSNFDEWKKRDLLNMVNGLKKEYMDMAALVHMGREEARGAMEEIAGMIKQLTGEDMKEPTTLDLDAVVKEVGAEKYWENLGVALNSGDFSLMFTLLSEIEARIQALRSGGGDVINKEFVQHIITSGQDIGFDTLWELFEQIWEGVKSVQAAADDEAWEEWKGVVLSEFLDVSESTVKWGDILPKILNRVLVQLDRVEDMVKAFRASSAGSSVKP